MVESSKPTGRDLDRDPDTGQPEDHVGGIAGGAFAGGAAVGAIAGSVIGGIAGKAIAEAVNPQHEDDYWRREFPRRPYATRSSPRSYDEDYAPAYRFGYERFPQYGGRPWDEVEPEFSRDWSTVRGTSRLDWADAREATRDAYDRLAHFGEREAPAGTRRGDD
jgi:hypothetical protein